MKDERTKAEKLAFTLEYLVKEGRVPGLLPEDVSEAAELLRDQERELKTLRTALAAKEHVVEAEAETEHYQKRLRATFIITDPRIYYGEMKIDDRLAVTHPDYLEHVARQLVRVGTNDWIRELEGRTMLALRNAIAMETRRAETTGSVAKP